MAQNSDSTFMAKNKNPKLGGLPNPCQKFDLKGIKGL